MFGKTRSADGVFLHRWVFSLASSVEFDRDAIACINSSFCRQRAMLKYRIPLREVVIDFYNELKSITSGYASFDYEEAP